MHVTLGHQEAKVSILLCSETFVFLFDGWWLMPTFSSSGYPFRFNAIRHKTQPTDLIYHEQQLLWEKLRISSQLKNDSQEDSLEIWFSI